MAMSKPKHDILGKIEWDKNVTINVSGKRIMEVCRVLYTKAISIEVIEHLLGGPNMDYDSVMELENSVDCFNYCKNDLLENLTEEKKEIVMLEDHQNSTSNIIVAIVKQKRSKLKREHIILNAVIRLTVMVTPRVGFARYITCTVRKPRNAKNLQEQVKMIAPNIFGIIYRSQRYIQKYLMDGGFVFNLKFESHKWKFTSGGPREPAFYVPSTPDRSPTSSTSTEIFHEDTSPIEDSGDEEGESTTDLANKISGEQSRPPLRRAFKFRKFLNEEKQKEDSPSSSPIILPSPDPILIISSDEELENSMVQLEEKVSLEMDTDSE